MNSHKKSRAQLQKQRQFYRAIGLAIRQSRNSLGMTGEQLAEESDFSTTYIHFIENAYRKVPLYTFHELAMAMDTTASRSRCGCWQLISSNTQRILDLNIGPFLLLHFFRAVIYALFSS